MPNSSTPACSYVSRDEGFQWLSLDSRSRGCRVTRALRRWRAPCPRSRHLCKALEAAAANSCDCHVGRLRCGCRACCCSSPDDRLLHGNKSPQRPWITSQSQAAQIHCRGIYRSPLQGCRSAGCPGSNNVNKAHAPAREVRAGVPPAQSSAAGQRGWHWLAAAQRPCLWSRAVCSRWLM